MFKRGVWSPFSKVMGYKLTPAGRFAVLVMFVSAGGAVSVQVPIYYVFCFLASVLFLVEMVGMIARPRLGTQVHLADHSVAGESMRGSVTLTNIGRWPAFDVMCSLYGLPEGMRHTNAEDMIAVIPPGESATLPIVIDTSRRGVYAMPPLRPHSTFPFNMMRFGRETVEMAAVHVRPAFHPIESMDLPASSKHQPGGVLIEGRVGASDEYVGNREYTFGQPAHRLDFRAWARLGKPVVREYQDEFCTRIALVLDTHVATTRWKSRNRDSFEAAVKLTASLADGLQSQESVLDLFAAGPELYVFRTTTSVMNFEKVLDLLAAVEPAHKSAFAELSPAVTLQLESVSTMLCVFLDWDSTRASFVESVRHAGCELRVLLVRDEQPTTIPFPEDGFELQRLSPSAIHAGEVLHL
ncbi:MAG: DUF58 domain-containing protein [Planctomycetaceae bacterium]|nr:DUF58 domain-containing protein [Planctomycetaceae bacterium]MCB9949557.1 DUF58 domain-containing protein [Planctomycetaceae bacterium]